MDWLGVLQRMKKKERRSMSFFNVLRGVCHEMQRVRIDCFISEQKEEMREK